MGAIPFDTHAFVKELTAAGVPEPQAEVHARVPAEVVIDRLATKEDLRALEERLLAHIDGRLKDLELRLTLRFGIMLAAAVAIIAALNKLL